MFLENFSDAGNLLYAEILCNIGVPKSIDLIEPWLVFKFCNVGELLDKGVSDVIVVFKLFLSDASGLDCELVSSSSTSNCFFMFSNSDRDGEFALDEGVAVSS